MQTKRLAIVNGVFNGEADDIYEFPARPNSEASHEERMAFYNEYHSGLDVDKGK